MTDTERMSVQTFAAELGELIRRYLRTFDPAAPTDLQMIRLQVTGANLGLTYAEQGGQPPELHIAMSRLERDSELSPIEYPMTTATEETDPRKGEGFWKR